MKRLRTIRADLLRMLQVILSAIARFSRIKVSLIRKIDNKIVMQELGNWLYHCMGKLKKYFVFSNETNSNYCVV